MRISPRKYRHLHRSKQRKHVIYRNYKKRVSRKVYKQLRKNGYKRPTQRLVITEYLISKWKLYLGVLVILSVILWFVV